MVAHGAVLTILLLGSRPAIHAATEFESQLAEYLFPRDRAPKAGDETLAYMQVPGGTASSPSAGIRGNQSGRDAVTKVPDPDQLQLQTPVGGTAAAPDAVTQQVATAQSMGAFILLDVDSAAVRDPRSAAPTYPREMEERGINGLVRMRFVVDSTGLVDLSTVSVLEKTNEAFARAVQAAMPKMLFRPAYIGSHAVRQLSEEDFRFEVQVARHDTASARKRSRRP
jgi:hypothetical protein